MAGPDGQRPDADAGAARGCRGGGGGGPARGGGGGAGGGGVAGGGVAEFDPRGARSVVVGWVERRETHHLAESRLMGFAALDPSYEARRARRSRCSPPLPPRRGRAPRRGGAWR